MKKIILILAALATSLFAQTANVTKVISTNAITGNLVVPTGKTVTINSGATITNNGTATGFGGAWGSITGTLSAQTDLQSALDLKLATATAASTYQPLDSDLTSIAALATTTFGRSLLTGEDAAATRTTLGLGTAALLNSGTSSTTDSVPQWGGIQTSNGVVTVGSVDGKLRNSSSLLVALGGTGSTTLTANNVLLGNGTSALQAVAPGTSGNVLTSNGTTWTSAAPAGITGTLTATRVPFATGASAVTDDADMTFATDTLTVTKAVVGAGSVSAPSLSFTGATSDTGIYSTGSDLIDFSTAGVRRGGFLATTANGVFALEGGLVFSTTGTAFNGLATATGGWGGVSVFQAGTQILNVGFFSSIGRVFMPNHALFGWADGTVINGQSGALDMLMGRDSAAVLQLGADTSTNSATAVAQRIKSCDATGTTSTGGSLTISGGTGTTAGGAVILATSATTGAPAAALTVNNNGVSTFAKPPVMPVYTVATLPATAANGMVQGAMAIVSDATAPTYLGTLTGGGAVVCPVFYNGSAWVSH
jgi:hypothetical protein